jgi:hypothetical protein
MKLSTKVLLSVFTAALVLSLSISSASANDLSVSEDEIEIVWPELEFAPNLGGPVSCPVSLLGTFHKRTITKEERLIGVIDSAIIGDGDSPEGTTDDDCQGGAATVLTADLPWHVTFEAWGGTLPEIAEIDLLLVGAAFQIDNGSGIVCLAQTDEADPAGGIAAIDPSTGQVDTVTADNTFIIDAMDVGFCAFASGSFEGAGGVENRNGGLLFIDLI